MTPSMNENMEDEITNILSKKQNKIADLTPKCERCNKPVYAVEELKIANKTFHKFCFKCNSCNKILEKSKTNQHNDAYYCQSCYNKNFGPNASSFMNESNRDFNTSPEDNQESNRNSITKSSPLPEDESFFKIVLKKSESDFVNERNNDFTNGFDQKSKWVKDYFQHSAIGVQKKTTEKVVLIHSNNCHACHKPVYAVEELRAMKNVYHKFCFKCSSCKKLLETGSSTEHQGLPYCRSCYSKNFGSKVYANDNQPQIETTKDNSNYFQPIKRVQPSKSAFSPYINKEETTSSNETFDSNVSTKELINSYAKLVNENKSIQTKKELFTKPKTVQYADKNQTNTSNGNIVRHSFEKDNLNKNLVNLKSALKKTQSSTKLIDEQSNKNLKTNSKYGEIEKCTRCNQNVYAVEKLLGGKKIYHTICFKCNQCNKSLNLNNYFEHNNEIYCKPCMNANAVQI